jgi:uncharacterized membrane protein
VVALSLLIFADVTFRRFDFQDQTLYSAGMADTGTPLDPPQDERIAPLFSISLWPHRSLPRRGFRLVLIFTAIMLCIPLIPLMGTPVGWAMIPFLVGALALLWYFIERNYRDGAGLREELNIWHDKISVERHDPNGRVRHWEANPYWVQTYMRDTKETENYLTLQGGDREIELGAFLSPEERLSLRSDLDKALGQARSTARR